MKLKIKAKLSLDRYLEYSSVLMVFMQGFVIMDLSIIDIKLFYFFLITNSLILILNNRIKLHVYLLALIAFFFIHGLITYTLYDTPYIYLIKQIFGISAVAVYYYNVFRLFNHKILLNIYLNLTIVFCIIALVFYPFGILDKEEFRMDGLMSEPSKFVIVNLPALFYFLKKNKYGHSLVLLLGLVFAQSSVGYIGVLLIMSILFLRKNTIKYLGFTVIPIVIFVYFLSKNELFQDRYVSTVENLRVLETGEFSHDTNLSTFALLKNAHITKNNFLDHPFGTGLGSFVHWHDKYIQDLKLPPYIHIIEFQDINSEDANSMLLRMTSDLGLFGLLIFLGFILLGIIAFFTNYDIEKKTIFFGMYIYFTLKFMRMGHYFNEEMYFFLYLLIFSAPKVRELISKRVNIDE